MLEDYRCNAVVDWIAISVDLARVTQHQWLSDAFEGFGRRPYIKAVDPGEGKESSQFIIKIQEPDLIELQRILSAIDRRYGLTAEPAVVAMEVSVDFRPKIPSDDARALLTGVLQRHIAPPLSAFDNKKSAPRQVWGAAHRFSRLQESKSSPRDQYRFAVVDDVNPPAADATLYFGAEDSDVMVRVMDKVVDRQNTFAGTSERLAPKDQRCRVEVTLQQRELNRLGMHEMADVVGFQFSAFQGLYFQFKLATLPANTIGPLAEYRERKRLEKFLATGISGLAIMDRTISRHSASLRPLVQRELHARGKRMRAAPRVAGGPYGTAIAYDALCKKVQTALANLSRSLKSADLAED